MNNTVKNILEIIRDSHLATGVDTSKYNVGVDWDVAEFSETLDIIDYAMIRATTGVADGTMYVDPLFEQQYQELVQHPHVMRDVYHYLSSHSSWVKQYDLFVDTIDGKEFEMLTLDCEKIFNEKGATFAGYAYSFLIQLEADFPDKRIKMYSNKYDYQDWFRPYYNFDRFFYHHAQYPWRDWDVSGDKIPKLIQDLKDIFGGVKKPNLPSTRAKDDYVFWQIASQTGIGYELGYKADYLDVNVSRLPLNEVREWSGIHKRWNPEGEEPQPPDDDPVVVVEPLKELYFPFDEENWRVTQYFGERPNIYTTSKGHNGVDFGIPVGNPIYCSADGTVIVAKEETSGYGRHVRIKHSHGITIYGHLSKIEVAVGDIVKAKQRIGLSGGATDDPYSGYSTGPHLHFEYRWDIPAPQVPGGYKYNAVDVMPLLKSHETAKPISRIRVICDALNVRKGHGTSYSVLGYITKNTERNVFETKDNWLRIGIGRWCSGYEMYVKEIPLQTIPDEIEPPEVPSIEERLSLIEERLDIVEEKIKNMEE